MPQYEIRLRGRLDPSWSTWFSDLAVCPTPSGETVLRGPVVDQAALHGVLARIHDLSLELLSVRRLEE
ncbi:MAG: hypothetical protein JO352_08685 [Chloroflexi bacterium]|nr:hypothetical protein [Chloroflexota bacterium]MBV9598127.1 hypothetical protein [Chloroflexota bacterium]